MGVNKGTGTYKKGEGGLEWRMRRGITLIAHNAWGAFRFYLRYSSLLTSEIKCEGRDRDEG